MARGKFVKNVDSKSGTFTLSCEALARFIKAMDYLMFKTYISVINSNLV